jgi:AcrR family transcriptional regulator
MPTPPITKQQVLAALAAEQARAGQRQGRDEDAHSRAVAEPSVAEPSVAEPSVAEPSVAEPSVAEPSMDELAAAAGVSRATLYRLFGSQQALLAELGVGPSPTVRSRILGTALDLVGRHGLAELSMDELAAAAGVSRATLYRLFPGKPALFAELVRSFSPFEPIAAVLNSKGDRPPAEVIPAVAHAMARAMDGRMGLLLQLLLEFYRSDPDSRASLAGGSGEGVVQAMRTLPLVARYLAEQMAAGRLRRMHPVLAFQALAGPIVMHLHFRPLAGTGAGNPPVLGAPLDEVVDELASLWLRAMATDDHETPDPLPPGQAAPRSRPARPRRRHNGRQDPGTGQAAQGRR